MAADTSASAETSLAGDQTLRIGSRSSDLAMVQARHVQGLLQVRMSTRFVL